MKPFAWSYSSLQAFETCAWRWNLTKHTKTVVERAGPAMAEGRHAHTVLEKAVTERLPLPPEYAHMQSLTDRIRRSPGTVEAERKIALTPQFTETTYFGKDVWFRCAFDVRVALPDKTVILDWKTGNRKLDVDQLKLFAAVEFKIRPNVETVETGYAWIKDKRVDKETYTRDEAPVIWSEFMQRVARVEHAIKTNNFPKRPSGLCRQYCPVGKKLCEHCGT